MIWEVYNRDHVLLETFDAIYPGSAVSMAHLEGYHDAVYASLKDDNGNGLYRVMIEKRVLGAIGKWSVLTQEVRATSAHEAFKATMELWREMYEFRFPVGFQFLGA